MPREVTAKILLVDDEAASLQALEALLAGEGRELVRARSGEEALRYVLKDEFALILLDVQMPGMDGFETAGMIRQRRRSYDTPIIFLTGHSPDDMYMFKGYKAGAVDYMIKPIVPEALRSKVAVFVDLYMKNAEIKWRKEQLRRAAQASEKRFYDLVQGLDAVVWEACPFEHRFSFVSQQAEVLLGYPVNQWLDDENFRSRLVHQEDLPNWVVFYKDVLKGADYKGLVYRVKSAAGEVVWVRDNVQIVRDSGGRPVQLRGVMVDITAHKQAEERLAQLAHYDPLTGIPNRLMLESHLSDLMANRKRYADRMAAVMFFDLDRFKMVNDTLGHDVGDELLRTVAARVKQCIRDGDMLARLGGDEFIAVIDGVSAKKEAEGIAQKILESLRAPMLLKGEQVYVTCSIGISYFPNDGDDTRTLLKKADIALYAAKQKGKDNFQHFSFAMNARINERRALEYALRHALEREEFFLHYQPKLNLADGSVGGFEALLRWDHQALGSVPPSEIIPILEETGMIVSLGEWVIRAACIQNKLWQQQGLEAQRVAVNVSARQLQNKNLVRRVAAILDAAETRPCDLEIEVTESMVMHDVEHAAQVLNEFRELGVSVALDDFGTGHSSLGALKRFPINSLKIDGSFIRGIHETDDASIVQAIIALGRSMGLRVVAEGAETSQQLDFLIREGCDQCQGNYVSRPLPATEVAPFVQGNWREAQLRSACLAGN